MLGGVGGKKAPVEGVDEHVDGLLELATILIIGLETTVDANLPRVGSARADLRLPQANSVENPSNAPRVGLRRAATDATGRWPCHQRAAVDDECDGGLSVRIDAGIELRQRGVAPGAAPPPRRALGWP